VDEYDLSQLLHCLSPGQGSQCHVSRDSLRGCLQIMHYGAKCLLEYVSFDVPARIRIPVLNELIEWPDVHRTSDVQGTE
jgi:hypothetical protein